MHPLDPNIWHLLVPLLGAVPLMGLSAIGGLLGGGGGGGGLGISGQTLTSTSAQSGAPVTVYNGSSGPLSQKSWLIIGAIALVGLLIFGIIFRGKSR